MRTVACFAVIALALPPSLAADDFKIEPGFQSLFNGKDLSGWKLRKGSVSLEGKTATAKNRFQVDKGELVIDGKSRGNMVIDSLKSFTGDVHIKFEFNASEGCNNDLYIQGMKFDIKKGGIKNLKYGEWQTFEIVIKGNKAEFQCDGQVQRRDKPRTKSSPLGIRAEFGAIRYRRLRYKSAE